MASAVSASANLGAGDLVNLIESSESALVEKFGHDVVNLLCTESTKAARAKQQARKATKASREARGLAWVGPKRGAREATEADVSLPGKKRKAAASNGEWLHSASKPSCEVTCCQR